MGTAQLPVYADVTFGLTNYNLRTQQHKTTDTSLHLVRPAGTDIQRLPFGAGSAPEPLAEFCFDSEYVSIEVHVLSTTTALGSTNYPPLAVCTFGSDDVSSGLDTAIDGPLRGRS